MPEYRRAKVMGGTFFITIVTYHRIPIFTNPKARTILHDAWMDVTDRFPFTTVAICLLPDHIHGLVTLPENDENLPIRVREIKRIFSKGYLNEIGSDRERNQSRIDKKESNVWQRRYYEHTIRNESDLNAHIDCIHFNPVKHGLVKQVSSWQWSSFHRYVKMGSYALDRGHGLIFSDKKRIFGE